MQKPRGTRGIKGQSQKRNRDYARKFVKDYLSGHPCTMCGATDTRVLQFHHINPKTKRYNVSSMVSRGMNVVDILKEIEKTIVLCSNCHIIHHYNEREQRSVVRQSRKGENSNVLAR